MSLPIRPNVLEMPPYPPGRPIEDVERELGLTGVVKLASNENPFGPSPRAIQSAKEACERVALYPDASAYELRAALSGHFGISGSQILLGSGSDELIGLLGAVVLGDSEDELLTGKPSFLRYSAAARLAGAKLVEVPVDDDLGLDLAAMADHLSSRTRIIFLANPNNPTGTIFRRRALDAFLARVPETAVVVLDEAYVEYALDEPDFPDGLNYFREGRPNLVVLRTFSKAYGLAGLRVGFGFAPAELVDAVNRARMPFNVNSVAQAAAVSALQDQEHLRRGVAHNTLMRARISKAMERHGARTFPSYANFVLGDFGPPAAAIAAELLNRGVIVRPGVGLGLPNALRVSVGTELEIAKFESALEEVMHMEVKG